MKTRTTLTGLFAMLARPFLDALRDEWQAWNRTTPGTSDHSPGVTQMMPTTAGMNPVVDNPTAADRPADLEPMLAAMPEPTVTISVMAAAPEPCVLISPIHAPEPVAITMPDLAVVEHAAPVTVPEPEFTVAAGVKCVPKPTKRSRKPVPTKSAARTSAKPRKPATRAKRSPACSTT